MRKDIKIEINSGDIVLQDTLKAKKYPIEIMAEGDTFLDLRIKLPANYNIDNIWTAGIVVSLSYIPIYKPMRIYICKDYGDGEIRYITNPTNNTYIFPVYCSLYGVNTEAICASQLISVNSSFVYRIIGDKEKGIANIYSGIESDVIIDNANKQNADLLLKCVPSNYYRYPTSGVGAVLYINSNVSATQLSDIIKREFGNDNIEVNEATFNPTTGELYIEQDTTKADGNV